MRITPGAPGHFVCASAGNHAQGVAYACRHFGARGTIFMPITTPGQKIDKTKIFGGDAIEIVLKGDYFDQTLAAAQAFCAEQGAQFLSPFDAPDVIEGQATVGMEMLAQLGRAPDLVVLPVGGGGLSAGVTKLLATQAPDTRFAFAEPLGGASLKAALQEGAPVALPAVDSFVDGAAVARIGALPFEALQRFTPADVYLAPEDRICRTMLEMLNTEGVVLEPAGALALDVLGDLGDLSGKTVVAVCSAAISISSACPRSRNVLSAIRASRNTSSCGCRSAPARCAISWTCWDRTTTSRGSNTSRNPPATLVRC